MTNYNSAEWQGSKLPRIFTPPLLSGPPGPCGCGCALSPETSYGFEAIDFADETLGKPYLEWQKWLVIHAGELLPDGRPRFRFVLVLVARQNGKTEIIVLLVPFWLFLEFHGIVLGTANKLEYAKKNWEKVVQLVENTPDLAAEVPRNGVVRGNNKIELATTSKTHYTIAASGRDAGRSLTVARMVIDELREEHNWDTYNAGVNAANAVNEAQIWMLSNQGDEKGVVLDSLRDSALTFINTGGEVGDYRLGLFEWSCPEGSDPTDPLALRQANPNLGMHPGGIHPENILGAAHRAKAKEGEELTGFKTEVMCMRVRNLDPAIPEEKWIACSDPGDMEGLRGRIALCLDISEDGLHACLVAAARMDDGRIRVEVVESWSGSDATAKLRQAIKSIVRRVKPRVLSWIPGGPAAAVGAELFAYGDDDRRRRRELGRCKVEEITGERSSVCMGLAEQVRSKEIAHSDDKMLLAHIGGAQRQWTGNTWVFAVRDAGPVCGAWATGGAVHMARTMPAAPPGPKLIVSKRRQAERAAEAAQISG